MSHLDQQELTQTTVGLTEFRRHGNGGVGRSPLKGFVDRLEIIQYLVSVQWYRDAVSSHSDIGMKTLTPCPVHEDGFNIILNSVNKKVVCDSCESSCSVGEARSVTAVMDVYSIHVSLDTFTLIHLRNSSEYSMLFGIMGYDGRRVISNISAYQFNSRSAYYIQLVDRILHFDTGCFVII